LKKIEWSDELSVGVASIDDDHKKLITIINTLFDEISKDSHKDILLKIFSQLEDYAHYHFDKEEVVMFEQCKTTKEKERAYNHAQQHKIFFDTIPHLKDKIRTSTSKEISFETVDFLAHWLLEHIISEDLSFTQSLFQDKKSTTESNDVFTSLLNSLHTKVSLSTKTLLIVLIPFTTILFIASILTYNTYQKYQNLNDIKDISESYICINSLVNVLQRERGLTNGYIASNYKNFKNDFTCKATIK